MYSFLGLEISASFEAACVMEILSIIWMELTLAAMAACLYVAASTQVVARLLKKRAVERSADRGGKSSRPTPALKAKRITAPKNEVGAAADATSTQRKLTNIPARSAGSQKRASSRDSDRTVSTAADSNDVHRGEDSCSDSERSSIFRSPAKPPWRASHAGNSMDLTVKAKAIRTCGKMGDLDGAIAVFDELGRNGLGKSCLVFNSLLDACVECGDMEKALSYFRQAKAKGVTNVVSYNTLMKGFAACNDLEAVEHLLKELQAIGLSTTQASFHVLLRARLQKGDWCGAWEIVEDMRRDGAHPNAVTCAILLKWAMTGQTKEVIGVLDMVDDLGSSMDEVLYSVVVEACLRIDRLDLLSQRLDAHRQKGCPPVRLAGPLYGAMIKAYGKVGDINRVWALWREIQVGQVKVTSITVGCLVEALVANQRSEEAWEFVNSVWSNDSQRVLVNTVVYSTIIKGYVCNKEPDKVMVLYDEMRSRGIKPNAITYNTILNAFAQCKAMHRAPMLLQEMRDAQPPIEPDIVTYSTIVKGYCASGELDKALSLHKVMKQDANLKPDEVAYNSLLDGCTKQNRLDEALELVSDMRRAGVPASNFTLSILVKLLGRSKRLNQAFTMVETFSKQNGFKVNVQVYTCLIQACFNNRQPTRAFAVLDRMIADGLSLDEKAYNSLLRGCLQARCVEKAIYIVRLAYGLVDDGGVGPGVDRRILDELLPLLCAEDRRKLTSELQSVACGGWPREGPCSRASRRRA